MDRIWALYQEFGWRQLADWFEKMTVFDEEGEEHARVDKFLGGLGANGLDELAEDFLEFRATWVICMKYGLNLEYKYRSVVAYRHDVLKALSGAYDDDNP